MTSNIASFLVWFFRDRSVPMLCRNLVTLELPKFQFILAIVVTNLKHLSIDIVCI